MWAWTEQLLQDIRYACRGMRRSPGVTAVTVLSLALGIGANTAIFSLIDALMLRLLPVPEPDRLVEFLNQFPGDPFLNAFSGTSYEYFRDHNHVFSGITADQPSRTHVRGGGLAPEVIEADRVAGNFFPLLGVKPALGRLIGPADDAVAVVSWSYWRNRFNSDPGVLGRRIMVDDAPVTIVGVAPRAFFGLQVGMQPDVWTTLALEWTRNPGRRASLGGLRLVARLKPGVRIEQARAEMAVLFRWTIDERVRAATNPSRQSLDRQLKFAVKPAGAGLATPLRDQFGKPLLALMAAVAALLLIACTNVAGVLLARGATRRYEMAVRASLGAGPLRLLRQVLTESFMLSGAGALLGIFFAYFGAGALAGIVTSGRFIGPPPRLQVQVLPDVNVLLFTCGIALLAGLLFGLAPAWTAFASSSISSLREGSSGAARPRRLLGKTLVAAQVGLSVALLSSAGLFIRHLSSLRHADLGFSRDHVLLVTLDPARSGLKNEQLSQAYRELLTRFEQIPGVRLAAISGPGPLSGAGASRFATVEGFRERPEDRRYVSIWWVGPRYFETLGTPLLAGRDFSFGDRGRPPIAIINEAMARYYFPGRSPIGEYLNFDGDKKQYEIVGVAGNAKYYEIGEAPLRTVYLDAFGLLPPPSTFALRTGGDPRAVIPGVRRAALDLLKDVPVSRVTTLSDQVDATIVPERLVAFLSGAFSGLGLLLAAIGIYGLLAFTVARRISEIGVRMAHGATENAIFRMVIRDALVMTCGGIAIGVPLAYWARRLTASLVGDAPAAGAFTVVFGAATMVAVALLAAYLPARRAARVDPIQALRHE